MTTLIEQHNLSQNNAFIFRVKQAALTVALDVLQEDPESLPGGVSQYADRYQLANQFIRNPEHAADIAAPTLATFSPTADPADIADATYISFISANWDLLAGYNPNYNPNA